MEKRRHKRAIPVECKLVLKPAGWFSFLRSNLAVEWLDVSEGGIGVLTSRPLQEGDLLRARLANRAYRQAFDVTVVVRHVRPSATLPGHHVAGCEFIDPSPAMRACIRFIVDTGSLPRPRILAALLG